MLLPIDADPFVYRVGSQAEKVSYSVVMQHEDGTMRQRVWDNGNDKNVWLKENPEWTVIDTERVVRPEPIAHALYGVRITVQACLNAVANKFGMNVQPIVYLTGTDNFRMKVGKIKGYKANRKDKPKPYHYQNIRDYLIETWNARVIDGHEADDEVSILCKMLESNNDPFCLATVDKDLDQVPGWHYDYAKKVFYNVTRWDAMTFFYEQVLSGDSTDNIGGVYRVGVSKARKIIETSVKTFLTSGNPEAGGVLADNLALQRHVWASIVQTYAESIDKHGDKTGYADRAPEEAAIENARLVKMLDYPGQLWTPPGIPDEELSTLEG